MKAFTVIFAILTLSAFANASCIGEAQIIAKVDSLKSDSMTTCRVMIKSASLYNESIICPLDLSEVMSEGIEIGLKNGHDCEFESDVISGILVKNKAGVIYLE